jgi:hypothetical protein
MSLRTKLRTGFRISGMMRIFFELKSSLNNILQNIKGSICVDCILTSCCPCCSALQIEKELESQGL